MPLPAVITDEQKRDLKSALARYELYLAPARVDEIAGRIAALLSHYWVGQMPGSLQTLVASDWLEDLGEFPSHAIEEACRRWRRAEIKRPKPAEIRDMCQRIIRKEARERDRIRAILNRQNRPGHDLAAIIDGSIRRMDAAE